MLPWMFPPSVRRHTIPAIIPRCDERESAERAPQSFCANLSRNSCDRNCYPMTWRQAAGAKQQRPSSPPLPCLSRWTDSGQRLWEGPKVSEGATERQGRGGAVIREGMVTNMLRCCASICFPAPPPLVHPPAPVVPPPLHLHTSLVSFSSPYSHWAMKQTLTFHRYPSVQINSPFSNLSFLAM